ncbi:MAG: hypothetical protein ACXACX_20335 [Candidatus Hodarchaeales archaeon]|jgi:hypothetical protein
MFIIDGLELGIYNFTIRFFDTSGSSISDTAYVTVEDTVLPNIQSYPNNFAYELGTTGNTLDWIVSDNNAYTFDLLLNGSNYFSSSWESGLQFQVNIDNLDVAYHNFTILMSDTSNNISPRTVFVTVEDTTSPTINSPPNQSIQIGTSSNTIGWTISDLDASNYIVYRNGTEFQTGLWASDLELSINIDGLGIGNHSFVIQAFDASGNSVSDTVHVKVVDSFDPSITQPADIIYEYGSTLNQIIWVGTDDDADIYIISRNETLLFSASWSSGNSIIVGIDGLTPGVYNYTITLYDAATNIKSDTVIVTVRDTVVPDITQPIDTQYEFGSNSNIIEWTGTDLSPATYKLFFEDGLIYTGGWFTDIPIQVNIDNLDTGTYNYTIVLYDASNNSRTDTVFVTVTDSTPPTLSSFPEDLSYSNGTIGNTLIWVAEDLDPGAYTVFRQEVPIESGSWVSSGLILINVDGLAVDSYNFTIQISDKSGNSISHEVTVTVTSEAVFTSIPRDLAFTNDTVGNTLTWIIEDSSPDSYIIYIDDLPSQAVGWSSGIPIVINVDTVIIGVYNYTIWVNDTDGNIIIDQVEVIVTDNPLISTPPSDISYNEGGSGFNIIWNEYNRSLD